MSAWLPPRIVSRWYFHLRFATGRLLFEYRHYRRLIPLATILGILTVVWSSLVIAIGVLLGGYQLVWQRSFAQNLIASLLVLPLGLAIGVVVGTIIQKHSLRFQARHAGDKLGDCVRSAAFTFILFLQRSCGLPIDLKGPINSRFVKRARDVVQRSFVESAWSLPLPPDFQLHLDETVDALTSCFRGSPDLRIAFPRSFDLIDGLESTVRDIKAGTSRSGPGNTALIVLHYAAEMIGDLEG